jgi:hypothetical protein
VPAAALDHPVLVVQDAPPVAVYKSLSAQHVVSWSVHLKFVFVQIIVREYATWPAHEVAAQICATMAWTVVVPVFL